MPSPTSLSQVRADAVARRDRGDLHSARDLLERALEAAIMTSGEDHPEVLSTAHLLASLHRQSGDLSGARRVLENALYAGSSRHGDEHPLLLSISFDLAEIADELGNRHEARKHYTRVARFGPAAPGFNQQQVQAARAWLGPNAPAAAGVQGQAVTLPGPEPLTAPTVTPPVEWPPKTTPPPPATPTLTPAAPTSPPPQQQPATPAQQPLPEGPTEELRPGPAPQQPATPAQQAPAPPARQAPAPPARQVPGSPAPQATPPVTPPPVTQRPATPPPARPVQQPPAPPVLQQPAPPVQQPPAPPVTQRPTSPAPPGLPARQQPPGGYPGTPMRPPPPVPTSGPPAGRPGPYPPTFGPQPALPAPVAYPQKKGKGGLIASIIAAVIAITAAGVTVYFALLRPDGGLTSPDRLAATNVTIDVRDDRVTISWTDPSNGEAQPIIVGNREGEGLRRFGVPAKGATTHPLTGLNKNFDYCFRVLLAYTAQDVPQSEQVCTNRKKPTPSPSR